MALLKNLVLSACLLLVLGHASAGPTNAPAATPPPRGEPDVAAMKLDKDGQPSQSFLDYHEAFLKRGKSGPIDLLFIGDSITAGWASPGKEVWKKYYGGYQAANFGIGGDRTEHVLWRIDHGELDGISPAVVVLLIGVNNGARPRVNEGVKKVVAEIREKLPKTRILLLGIFPHGADPNNPPWMAKTRVHTVETNKSLATLDDGKQVRFLDLGAKFIQPDGTISKDVMPDGLHPGAAGYEIWAAAMQPLLEEMLKAGNVTPVAVH